MSKKIGWIGLGRMGEAMVTKLLKAGHTVHVWNRTAAQVAHLAEYGAKVEANNLPLLQTAMTQKLMHAAVVQGDALDDYAAIIKVVERGAGLG